MAWSRTLRPNGFPGTLVGKHYFATSPGISHQNESHDGEEHEREEYEEGEVDGATDVVGKGGRSNSELFGRHSTSTCTVSTSVIVPKVWDTHCVVPENRTRLIKASVSCSV